MSRKLVLAIGVAWLLALMAIPSTAQSSLWTLVNGALRTNRQVLFNSVGSTAAPSIAIGERNTGMYLNGTGVIQFTSAGSAAGAISATAWTAPSILYLGSAQDMSFTRAAAGEYTMPAVLFAALGTPANGTFAYCSDCTVTTAASCPATQASCVCAGSGTGTFARRMAGAWYCTF